MPVIPVPALHATERHSARNCEEPPSAVDGPLFDEYIPTPARRPVDSAVPELPVEADSIPISGRGKLACAPRSTWRDQSVGDSIEIVLVSVTRRQPLGTGVECFRKLLDRGGSWR